MSFIKKPTKQHLKLLVVLLIGAVFGVIVLLTTRAEISPTRADINKDGKITVTDLSLLLSKYLTSDSNADINGDGKVTIIDLSIFLGHYGKNLTSSSAPYHIIYLSKLVSETKAIEQYRIMEQNQNVVPSFRSDSVAEYQKWEKKGFNYYYMSASSDFTVCSGTPNPYRPDSEVYGALAGKYGRGIYLHEFAAIYACVNGWNWAEAVKKINWSRIDQWAMDAKAKGKKVVWAEPAAGWRSLINDPTADSYFRKWGNTLVPVFATNYSHAPTNKLPEARAGALAAAQRYGIEFGESIQSWYWIDPHWPYTSQDAKVLAEYGKAAGATYFEIEGTTGDMAPGTTYMNGVNAFIGELGASPTPKQSASDAPLPTYH